MGGGGSFSAGGPGKGMHSRLCTPLFKSMFSYLSQSYNKHTFVACPNMSCDSVPTDLRVLNNYQQIESFSAFNSIYNNSGLFGINAAIVSLSWSIAYNVLTLLKLKQ